MTLLFCCLLCSCCALGCVVGIYSVWIVFCIGVVAVSKFTAVVCILVGREVSENPYDMSPIFNVEPCMLPHLLYNPTHALFTL